jgi:two-component system response regulator PilR (NtrC family)
VRILSATNRNLSEEVVAGRFREDLYYRLNVIQIPLPALHERRDDIPLLLHHFIEKFNEELGKNIEGVSEQAMSKLMAYRYPGNVRELENVVERSVALSRGPLIDVDSLPPTLIQVAESKLSTQIPPEGVDLEVLLADYERVLLRQALRMSDGVKKRAAQLLRVSFRSFRYRLEKLELDESADGET